MTDYMLRCMKVRYYFVFANEITQDYARNTKGGSITVLLTSCFTGLD
jgi:hypothetical protein